MSDSNEEDKNEAGLVVEEKPAQFSLLLPELDYLTRLVHVDQQRMIENRDHAIAYGARGFRGPLELDMAYRLLHSFAMARTAAAIDAMEAIEAERGDLGPGGTDTPQEFQ